jgi:group I intron endonuclease
LIELRCWSVYRHTTPSGKVYIGITSKRPEERWANGTAYRRNSYFYNAIQKYGWENIKSEVLYSGLSKEDAENKEVELIAFYDSTNKAKGYNLSLGGNAKGKHSTETRIKISKLAKERFENPENHPMYGRKHSEETKKHWCKIRKNIKPSKESLLKRESTVRFKGSRVGENNGNAKPVICIDTGERYGTMCEAQEKTGVSRVCISNCCNGKQKTAGGLRWRLA